MKLPDVGKMNEEERSSLIRGMRMFNAKAARQCEHIKTNGEFCGSPALRGRNYCYFHLTYIGRRLRAERVRDKAMVYSVDPSVVPLELPPLEDANAVQMSLMQVMDAILHNRLDSKRAGLLLYALQTASANLRNGADFSQTAGATVAAGYEDFEEDFELEGDAPELRADEEEEDEEQAARIAEVEEQAAEYAKLDAAEVEARARADAAKEAAGDGDAASNTQAVAGGSARAAAGETRTDKNPNHDEEAVRSSYPCGWVSQFFCSMDGPLARAKAGGAEPVRQMEREAVSQRIELGRRAAARTDEEEAGRDEERAA